MKLGKRRLTFENVGYDVIDILVACEKLLSGVCSNGKDWKVGLVGDLDEGLRREPLGSLDGNINNIAADVIEDRYREEVGGRKSY